MPSVHAKRNRVHKEKEAKLDGVRSEMNVTPLVDVCLVLLIIFMVILPMLERGKNVPLPETQYHTKEKDSREPIVVLDRGAQIYVDKEPVSDIATMKQRVEEEWTALAQENALVSAESTNPDEDLHKGEGRVLVKADAELNYGKIYPVILELHRLGASGIDLGTNEYRAPEGDN